MQEHRAGGRGLSKRLRAALTLPRPRADVAWAPSQVGGSPRGAALLAPNAYLHHPNARSEGRGISIGRGGRVSPLTACAAEPWPRPGG